MRVYVIGRNYQAAWIGAAEAAERFMAWLVGGGKPKSDGLIATWAGRPAGSGGLGALAESKADLAEPWAAITARWPFGQAGRATDGQAGR